MRICFRCALVAMTIVGSLSDAVAQPYYYPPPQRDYYGSPPSTYYYGPAPGGYYPQPSPSSCDPSGAAGRDWSASAGARWKMDRWIAAGGSAGKQSRPNCRPNSAASSSTTPPRSRLARSSSTHRTRFSIWCSATAKRCATASASAATGSLGPALRRISRMSKWPDWHPPKEMIARQPYLPRFTAGGEGNPMGARALYLGNTEYRIHGTNQPSTIGQFVSSGCIRLTNEDVEDLYSRVNVGTRVVVLPGSYPVSAAQGRVAGSTPKGNQS